MKNSLLQYYQEELNYLRNEGTSFANAHPNIAGKLKLGPDSIEDPFVERVLESFAFLTARLQHKIDAQVSTISDAILNVLYPNFLAPIPSMTTIQFSPKEAIEKNIIIEKNHTIDIKVGQKQPFSFSTCYPVKLEAIKLTQTQYTINTNALGKSKLSFCLTSLVQPAMMGDTDNNSIQIYLNLPLQWAFTLLNLLMHHVSHIEIVSNNHEKFQLSKENLAFAGFKREENLLPNEGLSEYAHTILQEYFIYPQKFLYVTINQLLSLFEKADTDSFTVNIYFDAHEASLSPVVNDSALLLGCTPAINLFRAQSMPININHKKSDYSVLPDCENNNEIEVYHITDLNVISENKSMLARPMFGFKHADMEIENSINWYHYRKSCEAVGEYYTSGDKSFINFTLNKQSLHYPGKTTAIAELICTNRDIVSKLSHSDERSNLSLKETSLDEIIDVKQVSTITSPIPKVTDKGLVQELIALLHLNHINFESNESATAHIKSILALFATSSEDNMIMINQGIINISVKPLFKRNPHSYRHGFCRGSLITVIIDQQYFLDNNEVLFGKILHCYLSKMTPINHFIELTLQNKFNEELYRCSAMIGKTHTL